MKPVTDCNTLEDVLAWLNDHTYGTAQTELNHAAALRRVAEIVKNGRQESYIETRHIEGELDEVVGENVVVHMEIMDKNLWWMSLERQNGERVCFGFKAKDIVITEGEPDKVDVTPAPPQEGETK